MAFKNDPLGLSLMRCMLYWQVESRTFARAVVCSTGHLCSEPISLQKWFTSSLPPTAKRMEWLRNNYFLLSLISKKGIQMEAEGEAGNVGHKSRAQTGTKANKSGSESVQTNQILLWTIASWAHYQDDISLWQLPIKNKLEELLTHCQWQNSSSVIGKENYDQTRTLFKVTALKHKLKKKLMQCITLFIKLYIFWSVVPFNLTKEGLLLLRNKRRKVHQVLSEISKE